MSLPVLRDNELILRAVQESDIAERLSFGRSNQIARMFGGESKSDKGLTEEYVRGWFDWLSSQSHAWAITLNGAFLGEIRLHEIDERDQRAKLAVGLYDEEKLGRGLGRRAIRLVLTHAFGTMGLHRVSLRVIAYNHRAIRCYRACGFREEGREREAGLVDGERHDDVIMGILANEFLSPSNT